MGSRNHSLDVLRSLAVILVVNCHIASTLGSSGYLHALQLGGKGVDLFFVLSGWLLGQQLLLEVQTTGHIEIKRFLYRRWMRTLPAYFAVLAFIFLWQIFVKSNWKLCWSYLFFGQNYLTRLPYFAVSWSLCVEEHFYLLVAPIILMIVRARYMGWFLPAVLVLPTVCRQMGWYHSLEETHVRYDQCATGVLLAACSVFLPRAWVWLCRLAPMLALGGLAAVCFNISTRLNPSWGIGDLNVLFWSLAFGSFVLLGNSNDFWKKRVRFSLFRYLAERSYALYLLHPESLALLRNWKELPFVVYFSLAWVLSLLLAEGLYRAVERPVMKAREWFSASAGRKRPDPIAQVSPVALCATAPDGRYSWNEKHPWEFHTSSR